MKKTLVLLTLLFVALAPFAAMAETITWSEVGEPFTAQLGLEGDFYALSDMGLAFWLPSDLFYVEPSAEEAAAGRWALFTDDDGECVLAIDALNVPGMTLDQACENAVTNGMKEPEIVNVNGIDTLSYEDEANNTAYVVLVDTDCNMIFFSFTPVDTDVAKIAFTVIASSIMPLE